MFPAHTSLTAPSAITSVSLTRAVRNEAPALEVCWTTPHSEVSITLYEAQYRRGVTSWRTAAKASVSAPKTCTILAGLDAGTVYSVRVRAVSAVGTGQWSSAWTERTYNSK